MKIESKLSDQSVYFTELTVKDYKNFLKETYGEEPIQELFMESVYNLLTKCLSKPLEFVKNLSAIDLLCLLIDIRINSVGEICEIMIDTGEPKPTTIQLNMDWMKEDLLNLNQLMSKTIQADNILINFGCPSLERFNNTPDEYLSFIKKIVVKDKFLDVTDNQQAEIVFDSLSPKTSLEIIETYKSIVSLLTDYNFLERYSIFEQRITFVPSFVTMQWFIKLMFSESLEAFYTTFFHMSYTAHMNAEYLENITVGEYKYFVSCLKKTLAQANQKDDEQSAADSGQ